MCKKEFLQIRRLGALPKDRAAQLLARRKRRLGANGAPKDPAVVDVEPRRQRAQYDEDELVRLGYASASDGGEEGADDERGDATFSIDEDERNAVHVSDNEGEEKYVRDGFVVEDDDIIYSDRSSELHDDETYRDTRERAGEEEEEEEDDDDNEVQLKSVPTKDRSALDDDDIVIVSVTQPKRKLRKRSD